MNQSTPNQLIRELRAFCASNVLQEKLLIAPSRRVGFQWVEAVTWSGQPLLNAHVESFQTLALLRLALPIMRLRELAFAKGVYLEVLVARLFGELREAGAGYLASLSPSRGLLTSLTSSLRDLRLAGLKAEDLDPKGFEVPEKGQELRRLLEGYEAALRDDRHVDYADVLRLAAESLSVDRCALSENAIVLLPEDALAELRALERALWESIPSERRIVLSVDKPGGAGADDLTDSSRLSWVNQPTQAPPPLNDGTAHVLRAVGEVNEVRALLQHCAQEGIPLDQVELLYTQAETYVPLIYECACQLTTDDAASVPATFEEGIPTRYSRPGRALQGWVTWIQEDYPQTALVRMLEDGLLKIDGVDEERVNFSWLATLLRSLPIGKGRGRYLQVLDREVAALQRSPLPLDDDEPASALHRAEERQLRLRGLEMIRSLAKALLDITPQGRQSQKGLLEAADRFLESQARGASELDEYARGRLRDAAQDFAACLGDDHEVAGLEVANWLADLPSSVTVEGKGPRPGCLHAAPLRRGGHSGRPYTFLLGLDDTRFPSAAGQDPVLLDEERGTIDPGLPTASSRLARDVESLAWLFARLRGQVTLSYCCHSLADDRALFPSSAIWSAYHVLSGNPSGTLSDLERWLPNPVSFAPVDPTHCLDMTDWWLWRTCGDATISDPEQAIAASYPHLGQGMIARQARGSPLFTEYDGYVPEAGAGLDPGHSDGPVLSASALERLGGCPLEYFFRYALGVEPPEEYELDPSVWLDPLERGGLLHSVFHDFMAEICTQDIRPQRDLHDDMMRQMLDREIEAWTLRKPVHNQEAFTREVRQLRRVARVFLLEEEKLCRRNRPLCCEAAIGLPSQGDGTFLDVPEPLSITLSDGTIIRSRGRIDRVDQVSDGVRPGFMVWDYKTGSAWRYERGDPCRQGRCVQSVLYCSLVSARLAQVEPKAEVVGFGYFFPSPRERGDRIIWRTEQLEAGRQVVAELCQMIRNGCFPFTDDPKDVRYSDYVSAFGDVPSVARDTATKLQNDPNAAFAPFRRLRGYPK